MNIIKLLSDRVYLLTRKIVTPMTRVSMLLPNATATITPTDCSAASMLFSVAVVVAATVVSVASVVFAEIIIFQ